MLFKALCVIIFIAVLVLGLYQNRIYKIAFWKLLVTISVGAIVSYWGIHLLAYVENGYWFRWSFFGCIFCVPVVYLLLAHILKTPYHVLMDFAGPMCALLFGLIKINCMVKGCCYGIYICTLGNGNELWFPSQLVESMCSGIILVGLLWLQRLDKNRGNTAPIFLISYGIMRFVLSFFRYDPTYFRCFKAIHLYIPTGQIWALICIIWGFLWMYRIQAKKAGYRISVKQCIFSIADMFNPDEVHN